MVMNWIGPNLCPPQHVMYASYFDGELNLQIIKKEYIETWITSNLIEDLKWINNTDHLYIGYNCNELNLHHSVDEGNTEITREDIYKFAALIRQGWDYPFSFEFSYQHGNHSGDYYEGKVMRFE